MILKVNTDVFKKKSNRNKNNQEKQVTKHTCGPLSFEEINFAIVSSISLQLWRMKIQDTIVDVQVLTFFFLHTVTLIFECDDDEVDDIGTWRWREDEEDALVLLRMVRPRGLRA
ncbi:hypothetical protein K1719_037451 [Acacia pycnantha]|nr:hypothetical protein K1719_037451 [Acacia pycnantha]